MGPLRGLRVLEIASMAPAPFGCMLLADLGAEVLRIDRAGGAYLDGLGRGPLGRGRRSVQVDLKHPDGIDVVLQLVTSADVLVEGFRPGVAERLGIGPEACLARNPRLIYGRMTGWGQYGPLALRAGHDINYIAISGALEPIGRAGERPVPPLNLLGDFGGGGALLALGVLAALHERERSGQGQIVDAAMVDGAALLTTFLHGLRASGGWRDERGTNLLDGGAPFYDTYATSDGKYVSVGALEPKFYAELLDGLGLAADDLPSRNDQARWPELRARFTEVFRSRTRDEWAEVFADTDACVAPVLSPGEAPWHPHTVAREVFGEIGGVVQPAPAPRFSRTPPEVSGPPPRVGQDTESALLDWGFTPTEVAELLAAGAVSIHTAPDSPGTGAPPAD